MPDFKPVRLIVAAKTFNIGTATIVEFLNKKGISVENKPTTKLTEEMYKVLLKEFRGEMDLKEEAEQITLGNKKRESVEMVGKTSVAAKRIKEKEVLIKSTATPVEIEPEQEIIKPVKKEAIKEEKKAEKKEEKKATKIEGPKVVGKIELKKKETKSSKAPKEEKVEPKEKTKETKKAPKEEKKAPVKEPVVEKAAEIKKPEEPKEEKVVKKEEKELDIHETKREKLEGPKILGKIELKEKKPKKKEDKPKESTSEEGKKRRRRRIIKVSKVDTPAKKLQDDKRKKKRKPNDRRDQPQVSEKEIEEKIKATMAKLSGGTGKSSRQKIRRAKRIEVAETQQKEQESMPTNVLQVTEFVSVSELANLMGTTATEVIKTCMGLGVIVSINQRLDAEVIELVADEFNYVVEFVSLTENDPFEIEEDQDPKTLEDRPPIVTIMGHVDHGKTTLLDYIREANVAAKEAGGITQHIGAYEVVTQSGKRITFLDTPGHEAFTAMRARGAKVTDVAVIVIAADDNVMPQTKEAISHAQSAGVPMIFAINKVDKENARPEKIKEMLSTMNLLVEDWGGKYQSQELSAKSGSNVDLLLEKISIESELLELKANPNREAYGSIIEASLDKGRGYVATLLVQGGTLKIGDMVVSGSFYGKVKAMFDHTSKKVKQAGPSVPVQVLGLSGAPQAGEKFKVFESEQDAKQVASKRGQLEREQGIRATKHITLDEIGRRLALGNFKELNVIIKGDVDGSIEALSDSLQKLSTQEIVINVLHKGVGQITESDVLLASASDAIIIGFQVRPSLNARKLAEKEDIEIRLYSIIYNAIDEIKSAMEGMLEPKIEEKIVANLEINEVFKITKVGTIAGCRVIDGKLKRDSKVRIIRDGIVVYTGELASLKRFKDDVKEVSGGNECGLNIKDFNDIKVGDMIEAYYEETIQRTL